MPDPRLKIDVKVETGEAESSLRRLYNAVRGSKESTSQASGSFSTLGKTIKDIVNPASSLTDKFASFASLISGNFIKSIIGATAAIFGLGKALSAIKEYVVEGGSKLQLFTISMKALLGLDTSGINNLNDELVRFARTTPFTIENTREAARRLAGFGFSADEATKSLEKLGKVAALTGNTDAILELSDAYGKMAGMGVIHTRELNRFVWNGVDAFKMLEQETGLFGNTLRRAIEDNRVPFETFEKALERATSTGGKYAEGLNLMSKSWKVATSNIGDQLEYIFASFGKGFAESFVPILTRLSEFINKVDVKKMESLGSSIGLISRWISEVVISITKLGIAVAAPLRIIGGLLVIVKDVGMAIGDFFNKEKEMGFLRLEKALTHIVVVFNNIGISALKALQVLVGGKNSPLGQSLNGFIKDALSFADYLKDVDRRIADLNKKDGKQQKEKEKGDATAYHKDEVQKLFKAMLALQKLEENGTAEQIIKKTNEIAQIREKMTDQEIRDAEIYFEVQSKKDKVTRDEIKSGKLNIEQAEKLHELYKKISEEQDIEKKANLTVDYESALKRVSDKTKSYLDTLNSGIKTTAKELKSNMEVAFNMMEIIWKTSAEAIDKLKKEAEETGGFLASLLGVNDTEKVKMVFLNATSNMKDAMSNMFKNVFRFDDILSAGLGGFGASLVQMAIKSIFGGNSNYRSISETAEEKFQKMVDNTNRALDKLGKEETMVDKQIGALDVFRGAGKTTLTEGEAGSIGISLVDYKASGGDINILEGILLNRKEKTIKEKISLKESDIDETITKITDYGRLAMYSRQIWNFPPGSDGWNRLNKLIEPIAKKYGIEVGGVYSENGMDWYAGGVKDIDGVQLLEDTEIARLGTLTTELNIMKAESAGNLFDIGQRKIELNTSGSSGSSAEPTSEELYDYAVSLAGKKLSAEEAAVFGLNEGDTIGIPLLTNLYSNAKAEIKGDTRLTSFEKAKKISGLKTISPSDVDIDTAEEKLQYLSQFSDDPSKLTDADYAVLGFPKGTAYGVMLDSLKSGAISEVKSRASLDSNYTALEQQSDISNIQSMGIVGENGKTPTTVINISVQGSVIDTIGLVDAVNTALNTSKKMGRSI